MIANALTKLACFALLLNDGVFAKKYKKVNYTFYHFEKFAQKPKYVEDEYMYEDQASEGYGFMRDQCKFYYRISTQYYALIN